jgi:hypothetical protein
VRVVRAPAALLLFLASPAFAEVCDKLGERSGLDTFGWTAGPFLACVVTTLLVLRGSNFAAAAATILRTARGPASQRGLFPALRGAQRPLVVASREGRANDLTC